MGRRLHQAKQLGCTAASKHSTFQQLNQTLTVTNNSTMSSADSLEFTINPVLSEWPQPGQTSTGVQNSTISGVDNVELTSDAIGPALEASCGEGNGDLAITVECISRAAAP